MGNDVARAVHTIDTDSEPAVGGSEDEEEDDGMLDNPHQEAQDPIASVIRHPFGGDTFGDTDDKKHFEKVLQHAPVTVKGRSQSDIRASHFDKARALSASANASTLDAMRSKAAAREDLGLDDHVVQQLPSTVAGTEVHLIESPVRGSRATPAAAPGNNSPLRDAITGQPSPRDAILQQAGRGLDQVDFQEEEGDHPLQ